jgi:hypothetical protein
VKGKVILYIALLSLSATSFADVTPTGSIKPEMVAQLKVSNAESDARGAVAHGDKRLLAVYGYTLMVPGVRGDASELRARYGLRILEGTSDAYKDASDREFNETARKYAATYNRVVIAESSK